MDVVNRGGLGVSIAGQLRLTEVAERAPASTVEAAARVLEVGRRPVEAAFLARALNALASMIPALDDRALSDAAGAPSDYGVLLRLLEQSELADVLDQPDPLASARLRGLRARAQLLEAEGGTIAASDVASLLGVSRQAVDKRRRAGRLIGLPQGRRGYAYPVWQFGEAGALAGLEAVLAALQGFGPWTQAAFLLNANTRLGGMTPLAVLQQGRVNDALNAARSYGEHGAA